MDEETPLKEETKSSPDRGNEADVGGTRSVEGKDEEAKQEETHQGDEPIAPGEATQDKENA